MPPFKSPVVTSARCAFALLLAWALYQFAGLEAALAQGDAGASRMLMFAAIVMVSALVASIAGFAFCALAGSALAYLQVDPVEAVRTMVICSTAIQLYAVWKIRQAIRWAPLWPMIAAGAATVPLGVWLLLHVPGDAYGIGLGVFLCAHGCYTVFRRDNLVVRGSPWRDAIAGALSGLAGGLSGVSGSFVAIWCSMRGWDKHAQRAVYQPFILVMQVVTIACLQVARSTKLVDGAGFVPFALLGGIAGFAIYQRLTSRQFHTAVSGLLMVSGLGLLSRSL
jgi:uncharacterized membrane protein YfcA